MGPSSPCGAIRTEPGNYDLYILDLDGFLERVTSKARSPNRNPTWSPDGKTFAFVRDTDGDIATREDNEIYIFDLATGGQEADDRQR